MELSHNTVLVTGGGSGIGMALAERFLKAGSHVIVCGRRPSVLHDFQKKYPSLIVRPCDLSRESERVELRDWAVAGFPNLNVLVNNAGIQRRFGVNGTTPWTDIHEEIAINFDAPIHLAALFVDAFKKQPRATIVNVTSGLSFVPLANAPVYCATKAGLHSFTLSLRHQLRDTTVSVVEVIPPSVNTDLGGKGLHTTGVPLAEFADAAVSRLAAGELTITYGFSEQMTKASPADLERAFQRMNGPRE